MKSINIDKVETNTLLDLKDFQKATVERVDCLYRNGQSRVLVADEVGMGKTLVARGVIAKTARIVLEENLKIFRVVYICSNQTIATQNISKLDVNGTLTKEDLKHTRLSMQHLKLTEQRNNPRIKTGFIQLTPITPQTSFEITKTKGNLDERALMYVILKRLPVLCDYKPELFKLLRNGVNKENWERSVGRFEERVDECNRLNKSYPSNVLKKIDDSDRANSTIGRLKTCLLSMKNGGGYDLSIISELRSKFVLLSISMLKPDLVIMDEFQLFRFLLKTCSPEKAQSKENVSDVRRLVDAFFSNGRIRILLLSATPYKLYSTLEEMEENKQKDEQHEEFILVMKYLFENQENEFETVWNDYVHQLREIRRGNTAIIEVKRRAENLMYNGVCRTERYSVVSVDDYLSDEGVQRISISEGDIQSYLQMGKLLQACDNIDYQLPVDYVKSCPFLMSYMKKYKVKTDIAEYFIKNKDDISKCNKSALWLTKNRINKYEPIPKTNARLEYLLKNAMSHSSELYLWIPPSFPYYDLNGVYKNSNHFSKMLVFSSWEMVPRMIATLVSYESERRTLGKLYKQKNTAVRKNKHYFGERHYPPARLQFDVSSSKNKGMTLFALLYPSDTLSDLYSPIDCFNKKQTLKQIELEIKKNIRSKLKALSKYENKQARTDARWYYLAPMLLDGVSEVQKWISEICIRNNYIGTTKTPYDRLLSTLNNLEYERLGKKPSDLVDVLTNMVLGSPSICIYRSNLHNKCISTDLAKIFINKYLNSTEATAIVELAYGKKADHWKSVLRYCKDGCFQAMFDEYYHLISEAVAFAKHDNPQEAIFQSMRDSLELQVATYDVDTFQTFKNSIIEGDSKPLKMRTGFAVGFTKSSSDDNPKYNQKNGTIGHDRKELVRYAFNSPLRPFVLATTQIGQEGLDFHYYCRKVMHWNLPGNPIDIEQREGRVNRYKCLAIRQNLSEKYRDITFDEGVEDVWNELFHMAADEKKEGQSDLVPYWCSDDNQIVKIERLFPEYPISKDDYNYKRMIKIISLYRFTLGQPRQAELIEHFCNEYPGDTIDELSRLYMNLSPFYKPEDES